MCVCTTGNARWYLVRAALSLETTEDTAEGSSTSTAEVLGRLSTDLAPVLSDLRDDRPPAAADKTVKRARRTCFLPWLVCVSGKQASSLLLLPV